MPSIRRPGSPRRPGRPFPRPGRPFRRPGRAGSPHVVVVGDLVLDVIVAPGHPLEIGTDVAGRVSFVQGGSAATTARWLARLGARTTLISAVGRDAPGRALVGAVHADGVTVRAMRVAGMPTARIAVLVTPDGERSFVPDRGAADRLAPADLNPEWFAGALAVHLPVYSLLGAPLGQAGQRAIELGRGAGASISLDLASVGPLLAQGRPAAHALLESVAPDVLFATAAEASAFLGGAPLDRLLDTAGIAVIKRGPKGATVLAREGDARLRFEVATTPVAAADTTGAGDAFDAGFLVGWFAGRAAGRSVPAALHRATLAGHRAAARQLSARRQELAIG